ncbi:probable Na(+)/H(+) antiporter [Aeropyrum pernix K1]|uniref:Probable Na(+)/H(+) antiporter n=1 Tax=Aeropyrum pernix (strain ATCC 700893 / DSM 11879 / JCM 9820 / NBRC 100138 / K1) TaxID=272557 RepID=Q9Y8U6_AERPE|nr:Na+/H+ antiporter NhaC family protein [Aeropyrum pernix]BAA81554.1 probable Na(+)/H(+) antiporter [Aeropyrum pernix K1]
MPEDKRFSYITFPLLPPLLAIALAIVTRQVLPALFLGVWAGGLMLTGYNPISATAQSLEWIVENATDSWNATILIFDFIIGAFVGLLFASGALHSAASAIAGRVRSALGATLASWIMGVIVFFDDYANTIVVGSTMRPIADRLRVSREMLSYIVDSTAAPVAGMMLVSTWIGFEVGLIKEAIATLEEEALAGLIPAAPTIEAYAAWLQSVPYRFYSIFALLLVLLVVLTRRHFGPMLKAEHRAVATGKVLRDGAQPLMPTETVLGEKPAAKTHAPAWLFAVSIAVLIGVTLLGMWVTGGGDRWWETSFIDALMNADSATALLWGSFAAYLVALAGALATRSLSFSTAMEYTVKGMYLMVYANAILLLAWSIKSAADAVGTAEYVVHLATAAGVSPLLVPPIIFLSAMFISFTTGTSWGTFGIMMPIAVPMAWKLAIQTGDVDLAYTVMYASIAAVFAGGIYGDHSSPISDTTIMSSMFTGADHIDHVNTQIPYALWAAITGGVLYVLFAIGVTSPLILLPVGLVVLTVGHYFISEWYGRLVGLPSKVPNYAEPLEREGE